MTTYIHFKWDFVQKEIRKKREEIYGHKKRLTGRLTSQPFLHLLKRRNQDSGLN